MNRIQRIAAGSIAVGLLVLGLKFVAYWLTGSIALYSDALESIVNVVTAVVALLAVWTSSKPADADHPYGHGKVEYFSAVLVGVLIIVAALLIFNEAYHGYLNPQPFDAAPLGLLVNGLASAVNGVWCWVLKGSSSTARSFVEPLLKEIQGQTGVAWHGSLTRAFGLACTPGWRATIHGYLRSNGETTTLDNPCLAECGKAFEKQLDGG